MANIFDYAKKELSQDAVITCILKEKDGNAEKFIRLMLGSDCPNIFKIVDVDQQPSRIDILVTIEVNGRYEAIIIEDKTNKFLGDNQIEYIDKVQKMNYNKQTYDKIYFVLFKTGDYYFWEKDEYDKLIDDYISKNSQMKKDYFKTYLLDDFKDFLNKTSFKYGWIKDYREHINGISKKTTWCTDLKKNSKDFVGDITGGKWGGAGSKNYKFGKADGNGDKGYELWLQGLCGSYDPTTKLPTTVKKCYYLLPIVCLPTKNNEIVIKFNIHLNLNPKSPHGYLPLTKCEKEIGKTEMNKYRKLQEKVIDEYKADKKLKGFTFTDYVKIRKQKKSDFLQICSCKVTCDIEDYKDVTTKIEKKLPALIDIVDDIKNKIDTGVYDYILI